MPLFDIRANPVQLLASHNVVRHNDGTGSNSSNTDIDFSRAFAHLTHKDMEDVLIADGASTSVRCYGVGGTAYGPRLGSKLGEFP